MSVSLFSSAFFPEPAITVLALGLFISASPAACSCLWMKVLSEAVSGPWGLGLRCSIKLHFLLLTHQDPGRPSTMLLLRAIWLCRLPTPPPS